MKKALEILSNKSNLLAKELTEQMGRPIAYTGSELSTAKMRAEYLLKVSDEVLNDSPGQEQEGFRRFIRKEPLGVVGPLIFASIAGRVSDGMAVIPANSLDVVDLGNLRLERESSHRLVDIYPNHHLKSSWG